MGSQGRESSGPLGAGIHTAVAMTAESKRNKMSHKQAQVQTPKHEPSLNHETCVKPSLQTHNSFQQSASKSTCVKTTLRCVFGSLTFPKGFIDFM